MKFKKKICIQLLAATLFASSAFAGSNSQKNPYLKKEYNSEFDADLNLHLYSPNEVKFAIPKDCQKIISFIKNNNPYETADQATFNDLQGSEMACGYQKLKTTGNPNAANDFVSDYDFKNGSLDNLPYAMFCDGGFGSQIMSNNDGKNSKKFKKRVCDKLAKTNADYSFIDMELLIQKGAFGKNVSSDAMKAIVEEVQSLPRDKNCRLTNWEFRGDIIIENKIVKCISVPVKETRNYYDDEVSFDIYIYRLKFTDFNKDGFLDAIIATSSVSGGSASSAPTYQIITKKSVNQKRFNLIYPYKF